MRVAVLFDNYGPYHLARVMSAAARLEVLAVEFRQKSRVYDWQGPDIPSDLKHVTLYPDGLREPTWGQAVSAIDRYVVPFRPDAIVLPGWSDRTSLAVMVWSDRSGIPVIAMSESNRFDFVRHGAAEAFKSLIVKSFTAGICGGRASREYLVSLGMPDEAIFSGINVVDNDYFARGAAAALAKQEMPEIDTGTPLDGRWCKRYFLASSRFIPVKNLSSLFDAYAAYRSRAASTCVDPWPLVIIGDGPLRPELEAKRRALGLEGHIHMPGFKQYAVLPHYYGMAGAFVLASSMEPWGLVVNEAMASGLPVVVSRRCGCVDELVCEGENGYVIDPASPASITEALWRVQSHENLAAVGAASATRIANWAPAKFGEKLKEACEYAIRLPRKRLTNGQKIAIRAMAQIQGWRA